MTPLTASQLADALEEKQPAIAESVTDAAAALLRRLAAVEQAARALDVRLTRRMASGDMGCLVCAVWNGHAASCPLAALRASLAALDGTAKP
jgi:hypothetical protein